MFFLVLLLLSSRIRQEKLFVSFDLHRAAFFSFPITECAQTSFIMNDNSLRWFSQHICFVWKLGFPFLVCNLCEFVIWNFWSNSLRRFLAAPFICRAAKHFIFFHDHSLLDIFRMSCLLVPILGAGVALYVGCVSGIDFVPAITTLVFLYVRGFSNPLSSSNHSWTLWIFVCCFRGLIDFRFEFDLEFFRWFISVYFHHSSWCQSRCLYLWLERKV